MSFIHIIACLTSEGVKEEEYKNEQYKLKM